MNRAMVVLGGAVLVLAGCGTSSQPATGGSRPDTSAVTTSQSDQGGGTAGTVSGFHACSLFTKTMAAAILGTAVADGKDQSFSGTPYPACLYSAAQVNSGALMVTLTIYPDQMSSSNLLTSFQSNYQGLTALPGIGDRALQENDGRLVVAVKGHVGCAMLRAGDPPANPQESTKAMAAVCTSVFAAQ